MSKPACPMCEMNDVLEFPDKWECVTCGHEWPREAAPEVADGPRIVAKKEAIPLTDQWQEHSLEFEISTPLKDQTFLRFRLPREVKGTFDLADTRLKVVK